MPGLQLSPSILTADFARLGDEIASVAELVDQFHLDVMDAHYVPNLTFGPSIVAAVRRSCDKLLHVHLMIEDPVGYAPQFAAAGADRISFHPEVVTNVGDALARVRAAGVGVGLAVHPDVSLEAVELHIGELDVVLMMTVRPGFGGQDFLPEVVPKVAAARALVVRAGASAAIEVDGGIKLATIDQVVGAGGEILVSGSGIFDGVDPPAAARRLRDRLDVLSGGEGAG